MTLRHSGASRKSVDMFAFRLTHKVAPYVAWTPNPGAEAIDAFTVDWPKYKLIGCFPPFSLRGKVLQFVQKSKTKAILVYPYWPTRVPYPRPLQMKKSLALSIKKHRKTLDLPYHPPNFIHCTPSSNFMDVYSQDFLEYSRHKWGTIGHFMTSRRDGIR